MNELAQLQRPPRAAALAQTWRHHYNDDEPDRSSDGCNLEVMSYIQQRQHKTTLLNTIRDFPDLLRTWNRHVSESDSESLPFFDYDASPGFREMTLASRRLWGPLNLASQPPLLPPPRARELPRTRLAGVGEVGHEDNTASQRQTAGLRQRNGQAGHVAHDSAETTATNYKSFPKRRIRIVPAKKKEDPDARVWDEINASLKPVLNSLDQDHSCVFLSSGRSDFCRISLVSLGNDKGPVEHWNSIRKAAYARRGRWNWPRWCGKPRLELAEIRALAPHPFHFGDLCGLYRVVSLKERIRELKENAAKFGPVAYTPGNDIVDRCYYNKAGGPRHNEYCFGHAGWEDHEFVKPDAVYYCGMEEQLERLEEISKLEAASMWSAALENPLLAAGNPLFPSGVFKSSSQLHEEIQSARNSGHIRGLAQIKFTGFRVVWPEDEPGFLFVMICCGGALLSCLGVLGFRIAYGDWGTAYTAGAYYVALAGIVLAWHGRRGLFDVVRRMTD